MLVAREGFFLTGLVVAGLFHSAIGKAYGWRKLLSRSLAYCLIFSWISPVLFVATVEAMNCHPTPLWNRGEPSVLAGFFFSLPL